MRYPLSLRQILALFKRIINPATQGNNRLMFLKAGLDSLGTDASPNDIAPDEYGCAETINAIHRKAFWFEIGGDVSTYRMYRALKNNPFFTKVDVPLEGDLILSPTGYGNGRGIVNNGHVGIISEVNNNDMNMTMIMSNSSATGTFEENYTLGEWRRRYVDRGGYPIHFFRRV